MNKIVEVLSTKAVLAGLQLAGTATFWIEEGKVKKMQMGDTMIEGEYSTSYLKISREVEASEPPLPEEKET